MNSRRVLLENDTALPSVKMETRDHLSYLAVQIVTAKYDLANETAENLVRHLYEEIDDLHTAFDDASLPS